MQINDQILTIVSKYLSEEQKQGAIIYLNKKIFKAKTEIRIGTIYREMPFCGYRVFIDLVPKANWGHPTLYLLIDEKIQQVEIIENEFPPWEELPIDEFVLLRYGRHPPHGRYVEVYND